MYVFFLYAITAVGHLGAIVGPWGSINTLSSAPGVKRGGERHNRGCLRVVPVVTRLGPLFFLPGCSGGFLRCRIQGDIGPGSLALWEGVASCRAWSRLSSCRVGASSECRCGSARLGWMARACVPSDSCGRAEMCDHRLIQRRQVLVSFFFSAVNGCKSNWCRSTDARRVVGVP